MVDVRRQMFPSKGLRKEMQQRHISCLQSCGAFLPQLPLYCCSLIRNISASDKECREEFPQQHSIMFVVLVHIHLRISRRATELRLFLSGIIQRQSSWNDRMLQEWIMKKKKPLSANKMKQKAILGYFHWLNALSPMGDCVGWGSLTQCWPARPGQWWILSKGTVQQTLYLFLLAASSEWQWCLFAAQMSVWRFPHTCISVTHKTHLLTLS